MARLNVDIKFIGGIPGPYLGATDLCFEVSAVEECENSKEQRRKGYWSSPVFNSLYRISNLANKKVKSYLISVNGTPETTCPQSKNPLSFIKRRIKKDIRTLTDKFPRHKLSLDDELTGESWQEVVEEGTRAKYDAHSIDAYVRAFVPIPITA